MQTSWLTEIAYEAVYKIVVTNLMEASNNDPADTAPGNEIVTLQLTMTARSVGSHKVTRDDETAVTSTTAGVHAREAGLGQVGITPSREGQCLFT